MYFRIFIHYLVQTETVFALKVLNKVFKSWSITREILSHGVDAKWIKAQYKPPLFSFL